MVEDFRKILSDNETIEAARITLRKFTENDVMDIFEYGSDEETIKHLTWNGVKTIDDARRTLHYYWSKPGVYAIELKENLKCIGCIELTMNTEHEKAIVGYMLNRLYWNKGYATEALICILNLCFEKLDLNRVEATYYIGNEGSGKVMEKCGMEYEGVGRQELKINGVFRDNVHYGITKDDWIALLRV